MEERVLNESALRDNSYPGRGIIMGINSSGTHFVQVYWLMGRSENSRNRIFVVENNTLRTRAYDPSKVEDPSLIIYDAMVEIDNMHIVSNGDQTSTIANLLDQGKTFEEALTARTYEPDAPHFTPRISGVYATCGTAKLSIIRKNNEKTDHKTFNIDLQNTVPGEGFCLHTYKSDGNPLPSFDGDPLVVGLLESAEETANKFWGLLNEDNRISIGVKFIPLDGGDPEFNIINKNGDRQK
ncbi:hypothetical protein A3F37_03180 [Candidatus Saccharibacteria bacterium RIFCSPHIGHO2_12_FULL_41_12]|nr:MAG: hypothetical protein A3F37_03180 [Candidatus Saccharibacteria bacterium RIFCSPHIGHO2_12_FULL_41_12]